MNVRFIFFCLSYENLHSKEAAQEDKTRSGADKKRGEIRSKGSPKKGGSPQAARPKVLLTSSLYFTYALYGESDSVRPTMRNRKGGASRRLV